MGGSSPQKTNTAQKTKTNQNTKQKTGPYAPTKQPIQGLLTAQQSIPGATDVTPTPQQDWAIQGLQQNAQNAANQYNPQQQQLINDLYAGGNTGRGDQYVTNAGNTLNRYLDPNWIDPNTNPYLQPSLDALQNQIQNQVGNQFALAGRGFSGDMSSALGKSYAQGLAPLLLGQFNTGVNQQQAAAGQMPGISNALDASALNRLNTQMAASGQVGALNNPYLTQLATSQTAAGLPYTNLNQASQFLLPIAQLGGTSQGSTSGTTSSTGTQTMYPATNPLQTGIGAGLGGIGLLGSLGAFGTPLASAGGGGWLTNAFG